MQKLKIQYAIFLIIVILLFGTIVINQKLTPFFEKKADQKINTYIEEHYKDLKDMNKEPTKENNNSYTKIIRNKHNKNYYFKVTYKDKTITSTYQKDYVEGYSFLKYISNKIEKDINKKVNKKYKVLINNKLNKYSENTKNNIIKEKDLLSSEIYSLEIKINTKTTINDITNSIISINNKLLSQNIKPKSYNFIIIDSTSKKEIKINNLVINNNLKYIINDIILNRNSDLLKNNNITYEKLD